MVGLFVVLGLLIIIVVSVLSIGSLRSRSMRSLAARLGFEYMDQNLPDCFPSKADPFDKIQLVWNVLSGKRKNVGIVVFDGLYGAGRGISRTYIAVQTAKNPFPKDESLLGNVLQSGGWTVLFGSQPALNLISWSLGSRRIEEYLNRLDL
jgi:hypothetical protein